MLLIRKLCVRERSMFVDPKNRIYMRWTQTAYECYKRNCICKDCDNRSYCKRHGSENRYQIPHMKYTVIMLWANLGQEGFEAYERKLKG